jgi:ABC-type Fe3+ transport system permease subunit
MWPATLAGMIYTFMTAISIFEVPAMLGAASGKVPVLSTELFYAVRPGGNDLADIAYGAAGVYGTLIAVPSIVALDHGTWIWEVTSGWGWGLSYCIYRLRWSYP